MNVPPVFRNTIVRAQDRVAKPVSNVAEKSCVEAIQEEKELQLAEDQANSQRLVPQMVMQ